MVSCSKISSKSKKGLLMTGKKIGSFITLEGIDGSGKSTLAKNLAAALTQDGHTVLLTKEPGGSKLGVAVREILHQQPEPLEAISEFLLFAADRAEHFRKIIIPALEKNMIVISDRCADSSLAYQGYGRGLDISFIREVNALAMAGVMPKITLFIEIDPEIAFARIKRRSNELTSIESRGVSYQERVQKGFNTIFSERSNVIRLDGNMPQEKLLQQSLQLLKEYV